VFDALKKLMFGGRNAKEAAAGFSADAKQLAEAALMFHVIAADGVVSSSERKRLSQVLSAEFGLSERDARELIEEARRADGEAIDLFAFTQTLKRELDRDARLALIRRLWEMVYADGEVHEFEDNIVWRVAELLDIDSRARMELKREVRLARGED